MRPLSAALLLAASLQLPQVLAWGAAGHEIVATIAQIHLHPSVYPTICSILNFTDPNPEHPQCHLAPIAAWADKIRFKMRWSAVLHYVGSVEDHPSQICAFPGQRGWAGRKGRNLLAAIRNTTGILQDWADSSQMGTLATDDAANEALRFLVHFMGDLHMPLHLTGRDRGGNSVKVRFGGRITNLHSLWDGLLIAKAIRETPSKYSRPLPSEQIESALRGTIYDPYVRRIMWEGILNQWADEIPSWVSCPSSAPAQPNTLWQQVLTSLSRLAGRAAPGEDTDDDVLCPFHWAEPIHALNCDIIWPEALDEPPYRRDSRVYTSAPRDHHGCTEGHDGAFAEEEGFVAPRPVYLELDTPEYAGAIKEQLIIEKLLAQAGIRLAAVLNWLFADLVEEGNDRLRVLTV